MKNQIEIEQVKYNLLFLFLTFFAVPLCFIGFFNYYRESSKMDGGLGELAMVLGTAMTFYYMIILNTLLGLIIAIYQLVKLYKLRKNYNESNGSLTEPKSTFWKNAVFGIAGIPLAVTIISILIAFSGEGIIDFFVETKEYLFDLSIVQAIKHFFVS